MPEPDEKTEEASKEKKKQAAKKLKQKNVLICFRVKADAPWAVYPRLFNDEETALTKLEQSYPFEEHHFETLSLP